MKTRIVQLAIVTLGFIAGFLIFLTGLYLLSILPYSEEYLANIEPYWKRISIFYIGLLYQFFISVVIVLPVFGFSLGIINHEKHFSVSRHLALGALLATLLLEFSQLAGRNSDIWYSLFAGKIIVLFLVSYISLVAGAYISKHLTRRSRTGRAKSRAPLS